MDVGKRRAVAMVELVLAETKVRSSIRSWTATPGGIRKVFQSVISVYFSEVQQEVLGEPRGGSRR